MIDFQNEENIPQYGHPDIYRYHDYRQYMKDWFAYKKRNEKGFSKSAFAKKLGVSTSYLPMVLAGSRTLQTEVMEKIIVQMKLNEYEATYFDLLRQLSDTDSMEERNEILKKLQKSRAYQKLNPKEIEVYKYLSKWYYVAIREMVGVKGFKPDAKWIKNRLKAPVSLREIKNAIEFLEKHDFIVADGKGSYKIPEGKPLECSDGVYLMSMGQYYRQMLNLGADAIFDTPGAERNIASHTIAISKNKFKRIRETLDKTLEEINGIVAEEDSSDSVYHISLLAFPVVRSN